MTTKVTVETHDWPVAVSVKDKVESGYSIGVRRVEPNSREEFHLTDTRSIKFEELPIPQPASEDPNAELGTSAVASVG